MKLKNNVAVIYGAGGLTSEGAKILALVRVQAERLHHEVVGKAESPAATLDANGFNVET